MLEYTSSSGSIRLGAPDLFSDVEKARVRERIGLRPLIGSGSEPPTALIPTASQTPVRALSGDSMFYPEQNRVNPQCSVVPEIGESGAAGLEVA